MQSYNKNLFCICRRNNQDQEDQEEIQEKVLKTIREITLMRAHTHVGWAHQHPTLQQRVSTTFLIQKNSNFSCAPDGV